MKKYIFILALAILMVFTIYFKGLLWAEIYDWEDLNKTMKGVELLFKDKEAKYIDFISSNKYLNSNGKKDLVSYVVKYHINLAYSSEYCIKRFPIIKGDHRGANLIVELQKNKDRFWFVHDAYILKNKSVIPFEPMGFKPLALEYNFSDLTDAIKNKKISEFIGLAPHGKLNKRFFTRNEISTSDQAEVYIKDIILHKSNKVKELIFIKLKYYSNFEHRNRGWLIEESGSMMDLYKSGGDTEYFKRAINKNVWNQILDNLRIDLSKDSPYFYAVTTIADITKKDDQNDIKILDLKAKEFNWDDSTFLISIKLNRYHNLNFKNIDCQLNKGAISIGFPTDILPMSVRHKYFRSDIKGERLLLKPTNKAPFVFGKKSKIINYKVNNGKDNFPVLSIKVRFQKIIPLTVR